MLGRVHPARSPVFLPPGVLIASDGAPYYSVVPPFILMVGPSLSMHLPPAWVQTERPQLTKTGYKSAANQ